MFLRFFVFLQIFLLFSPLVLRAEKFTVPGLDGNNYLPGQIDLSNAVVDRISLPEVPVQVTGYGEKGHFVWFVRLSDSSVFKIVKDLGKIVVSKMDRASLLDAPISLDLRKDPPVLFDSESYGGNDLTYPVGLPGEDSLLTIDRTSSLIVQNGNKESIPGIVPLKDGRVLQNGKGQILLLTGNSMLYPHGVLGDSLEADGYAILKTYPDPLVLKTFSLPGGNVFETLKPLWVDINGDGEEEIIQTVSNNFSGSRIQVYSSNGKIIAVSSPTGRQYRWMHVIAAAPLGPQGETEIAAVTTPHLKGSLVYYKYSRGALKAVNQIRGFSTHRIGSRNLEMALCGDFDNDKIAEVLIPSQDFSTLSLMKRIRSGSKRTFSFPLAGSLTTNIGAFSADGKIYIAFGSSGKILYLFS